METKTNVVKAVRPTGRQDQYGNWSFNVTFDNGDEGLLTTKTDQVGSIGVVVGKEFTYDIEKRTSASGKDWFKISKHRDNTFSPKAGGGNSGWTPEKERSVMIQGLLKSIIEAGVDRKHWETFLTEAIALHDKLTKGFTAIDQKAEIVNKAFAKIENDDIPF